MSRRSNRRDFLKQTALAGIGFWAAGGLTPSVSRAANERLRIACIGAGVDGKGSSDTDHAAGIGDVVAICDIDDNRLGAKANHKDKKTGEMPFAKAKRYHDFRKLLQEMEKEIDAVVVSTPDHTHAPASVMAMRMKKHVYCQKPLTHSVYEARLMRDVARASGVCTQMGNQGTASNGLRQAVEMIQAGVIGPVRQIHVWTNRPVWPQAPGITARPKETQPVPPHVHWDLFLGPAPDRPYHSAYHPFRWRGWWDFGTGALGDMACHTANMAFMACKLGHPTSIVAESAPINPETYPAWAKITFEFPARGDMPPLKFIWYEGNIYENGKKGPQVLPPAELIKGEKFSSSGSLLVGDKGVLFSPNDYGEQYRLLPAKDFEGYKPPDPTLPRNGKGDPGMKAEWAAAIRAGKPSIAVSNFDYAAMLTETILLGNVAMRVGKKIEWDGPNLKATNCPEAAQYIKREYRKGWEL